MAPRVCLPGELVLDGIIVDHLRAMDHDRPQPAEGDWARPLPWGDEEQARAKERGPYVALRWVLNSALGVPLEPFTVWRRSIFDREPAVPIAGWHQIGLDEFGWDGVTEYLRIEIDLVQNATVEGFSRPDRSDRPALASASGTAGQTVVLEGGPMLRVRVSNPGAIGAIRGQSVITMANGDGWEPFEVVGLPFAGSTAAGSYYQPGPQPSAQGPIGSPLDPVDAARLRLDRWAPVVGWAPLAGLPPWVAPEPKHLVQELQADLLPDLAQVLRTNPPPDVARQALAEVRHQLTALGQIVGSKARTLNGAGFGQKSEVVVRPLQALTTAVASDTWSSLALGFGTGDDVGAVGTNRPPMDYLVTAPWRGLMKIEIPQPNPFPWPFDAPWQQPSITVDKEVDRELCAIVLNPGFRNAPAAPAPLATGVGFEEGAPDVDQPYHCGVLLRTNRTDVVVGRPRTSGFGLARYDEPGTGRYQLREHPLAKGWIPLGSAEPVRTPLDVPDPTLVPGTVMLRDSGVPRPVTGANQNFQYAATATDLFGQWGPWAPAWLSLGPAGVQTPAVPVVSARATAGPGNADPCALAVTTEVVWDRRERSCSRLRVVVDVYPPTPPPAPYADPPASPQPLNTRADVLLGFDAGGVPLAPPAGVTVIEIHDDGRPVTGTDPADPAERRYRIGFAGLAVAYGGQREYAVATYVSAEETIRPGEWSHTAGADGWGRPKEAAIAPNPIAPPTPPPLPLVYPDWASLPDAAGVSFAPVTWTPTGAWRYRVYEATEAALLAACGEPGPVLTDGFSGRMQALFDLYQDPANLARLRSAYRKLGDEPVSPTPGPDGRMRFQAQLPRGSALIHCFVVAGVTQANVVSDWPLPDADGRKGFLAYAIPAPRQLPPPELSVRPDETTGAPRLTVRMGGSVPADRVEIYRAGHGVLARSTGTMQRIATVPADPGDWRELGFVDATATVGWSRLHYRVRALTADDLDHAGAAVPSAASNDFPLLHPPPDPPTLVLTANVTGSTATAALVRVDTDALRQGADIGDFVLAMTVRPPGEAPRRFRSALSQLSSYPSAVSFVAGGEDAGYVDTGGGSVLHLRLDRLAGQPLGLAVDLFDPLSRSTHAVLDVPGYVPGPPPTVTLGAARVAGVVRLVIDTNVPLPPDPAHDWTLLVGLRKVPPFPITPTTSRTFAVSTIETIASPAAMPNPAVDPAPFQLRRVEGTRQILAWARASVAQRVAVRLTNAEGEQATDQAVTS